MLKGGPDTTKSNEDRHYHQIVSVEVAVAVIAPRIAVELSRPMLCGLLAVQGARPLLIHRAAEDPKGQEDTPRPTFGISLADLAITARR
jgi:hypothetical protein